MFEKFLKDIEEILNGVNELKNDNALKAQEIEVLKAEIADKDQKILQLEDELVKAKEDVNRVSAEELEQLERAIAELKTIIMAQEDESNE